MFKVELRIHDKIDGRVVPMGPLLVSIGRLRPKLLTGTWTIAKGAYGYGEKICSIEDSLTNTDTLEIEGEHLFPILEAGDEYFYSVSMSKKDSNLELGLFDSSYLLVKGPWELLNRLAKDYHDTELLNNADRASMRK
mgnify:CR=1 FL=1